MERTVVGGLAGASGGALVGQELGLVGNKPHGILVRIASDYW